MTAALPAHPAADLFPMLPASELQALADDIKANGQREPVVIWEGSVLDGRNRLAACRLAGVEPLTRTLDTCPDPLAFVISANLRRRNLRTSQLAMVAGRMSIQIELGEISPGQEGRSREIAARLVGGVEADSVKFAIATLKHGIPELVDLVDQDKLAVSVAAKAARFDRDRQRELVAKGAEAVREAVKAEVKPREPKSSTATAAPATAAPAPTPKTPGQAAEEKIRAAATLAELDAAYQEASRAGLSDRECEAVADARQERGAELRAQTQTTAPAPAPAAAQPALPALASTVPAQHRLFDEPHALLADAEPWLDGRAKRVMRSGGPGLVAAVWAGKVTVRTAADLMSLPAEQRDEIVAGGPVAIRSAAKEIREHRRKCKARRPEAAPVQLVIVELSEVDALRAENERLRAENAALKSAVPDADANRTRRPALKVIQGSRP